jgi:Bacterial pre-peptidase C-terminal domain
MKHALRVLVPVLLAMAAVPAAAQQPRLIPVGQPMAGELDASDSALENGSRYETWSFEARAGQLLIISMGSDDFDTYASLGEGTGGEFREINSNDDSLGSTDSSIEFRVPRDGTYLIRAGAFSDGVGRYTLIVYDASS